MPTRITAEAIEEGTFILTAAFTDESGAIATPQTLTWTLTDTDGTVINSRQDVIVTVPASIVYIPLSGDDLALANADDRGMRIVTLEGTYMSAVTQTLLPFKESVMFRIRNLVAVT